MLGMASSSTTKMQIFRLGGLPSKKNLAWFVSKLIGKLVAFYPLGEIALFNSSFSLWL